MRDWTFRFGEFTLDAPTRRLLGPGAEVHLSPKALDLLMLLVENRTRAVSKADLQAQLWPETYVLETNLASLIAEIRRALGDAPDEPRFIRTVPRFGYWFIGTGRPDAAPPVHAGPVRFWLVWDTRQIPLVDGDNIIGRSPDATVWIDAAGVSRHHARIRVAGGEAIVEDLGSKNGTYVRGQRVTAALLLSDGDPIRLGSMVMTFRIPPGADTTGTLSL